MRPPAGCNIASILSGKELVSVSISSSVSAFHSRSMASLISSMVRGRGTVRAIRILISPQMKNHDYTT